MQKLKKEALKNLRTQIQLTFFLIVVCLDAICFYAWMKCGLFLLDSNQPSANALWLFSKAYYVQVTGWKAENGFV